MKETPETIYLQIENGDDQPVSWADESIYENDVRYLRADKYESLKCCGNCDHYRTIPVKYHLEEYCNIIEDPQERRDIAKYDTKCTNWKQKENL